MRLAIQRAYYQDAKNPSINAVLITCATELGLDINQFSNDLVSVVTNIKLTEHRHFARQLGVSSYPSLRLVLDSEIHTIAVNHTDTEPAVELIKQLCNNQQKVSLASPCIKNCCLNGDDMCVGCFRLMDEITHWAYCDETEQQAILDRAAQRKSLLTKKPT